MSRFNALLAIGKRLWQADAALTAVGRENSYLDGIFESPPHDRASTMKETERFQLERLQD